MITIKSINVNLRPTPQAEENEWIGIRDIRMGLEAD